MATSQYGNPDHRRAVTVPAPSNEEIEARLRDLLTPGTFANLKTVTHNTKQLRDRVLTLPVMAAIVLSLVYRQVSGLSEVLRLLEQEGLMWAGVIQVSKQALSNRLRDIPAQLFAQMFEQVITKSSQQVARILPAGWEQVESKFAVALRQPLEQISVEMVFRSLYHFSRARPSCRANDLVPFLVDNARSFGLFKAQRKRHRYIKSQSLDIWASFLS